MRVLVHTDDLVGPSMAGSALRAWELARVLLGAGHEVVLSAAAGSSHPEGHGPPVVTKPPWRWPDAILSPPWCLPPRAFLGHQLLVIDGITPLLAELSACPSTPEIVRRQRTAGARLPLVASRADAILVAGDQQAEWWSNHLVGRTDVPLIRVPFGIPDTDPPADIDSIEGVPAGWSVVLWWGGVWPWLDLDTLLAARARLGSANVSVVVPTAERPGSGTRLTTHDLEAAGARHGLQIRLSCRSSIGSPTPSVIVFSIEAPFSPSSIARARRPPSAFAPVSLDGVWAAVPLLLSEGGVASDIANSQGWGAVVPPGNAKLAAAALDLLLADRSQERCRAVLTEARDDWRWSVVAQPLVETLPELGKDSRRSLVPASLRAAAVLAGRTPESVP